MSSSALKSLMQYRFKKQNPEKLQPASSQETTEGSPGKSLDTCIPETPSPAQSPVFKAKPKKYSRLILPDDSDSDETDSYAKEDNSSPWLSKQDGQLRNGHVSSSLDETDEFSSQPSTSHVTSSYQSSSDHLSFSSKVQQLKNIFPHKPRHELEAAVNDTPDIEAAINAVMGITNVAESNKRRRSQGEAPVKVKRRRILPVNDSIQSDEEEIIIYTTEEENKIKFLLEAFPNVGKQGLANVLKQQNWSIENSSRVLSKSAAVEITSSDEEDLPDVQTAMNGVNIRSLKTAQNKSFEDKKKAKKLSSATDDDSFYIPDDDDEDEDCELIEESDDSLEDLSEGPLSREKQMLLSFFNEAVVEELMTMPGCSRKKADLLDSLRPFTSWDEMVNALVSTKGLTMQLLTSCKELIYIREDVSNLMKKCEKIAEEIEGFVSDLMENVELSESEGHINRQPSTLSSNLQLKPYQMVGLNWLMLIHKQELNGILADEMGLGKTVQAIAFLAQLLENGDKGPHVIVVPSSTLDNWLRELKVWCPSMKVLLYYGSQDERKEMRFNIQECGEEFNVLVTTYNLATGSLDDRLFFKKFTFHYAVLDEAHMVKNMSTLRYQNLMKIKAQRRLLLTGTPLQNNLVELMSLLCFVMPDMFIGKTDQLKQMFTNITKKGEDGKKSDYERERIAHAKQIMKPFVLRRLKTEVLQQLPKKSIYMEYCPLTCEQEDVYNTLVTNISAEVRKNGQEKIASNSSNMMMQLRKAACHPLLIRTRYTAAHLKKMSRLMLREPTHRDANPDLIFEDMEVMSDFELHKTCIMYPILRDYTIDEDAIIDSAKLRFFSDLLPKLKNQGDRVLVFSQFTMMMDILEDYMKLSGHKYFRLDGQTPVVERQERIDKFNNDPSVFIFLLSTRAGGLGINLTSANVVIMHDLDFNPHNDKQAEDRCHRVGQTRDVTVYRLITKHTIEEAILRCAESKLELEKDMNYKGSKGASDEKSNDVAKLLKQALGV